MPVSAVGAGPQGTPLLNAPHVPQHLGPQVQTDALAAVDPRVLDRIVPPRPPEQVGFINDAGMSVLDEFPAVAVPDRESSPLERVESLLQQAQGDEAFRRGDYQAARLAYEAAQQRTPRRAAVWFRLMLVSVAEGQPSEAVGCLKAALSLPADGTRAWITASDVYGPAGAESAESVQHSQRLREWLAERPLSADRLLLLGTYQQMRGDAGTAEDLLSMASHEGPEAERVQSVRRLAAAAVRGLKPDEAGVDGDAAIERSDPVEMGPIPARLVADSAPVSSNAPKAGALPRRELATDGIVLRGKRSQRTAPAE